MAAKARIYLFYGSDNRASRLAVRRWQDLFAEKYGQISSHIIEADELTPAQFSSQLEPILTGQNLFKQPQLIIIKRLTENEKGASRPFSQPFLAFIEKRKDLLHELVTIVLWIPTSLSATHPLLVQFQKWQNEGIGQIQSFSVPEGNQVIRQAQKYLGENGIDLDEEASKWLQEQYQRIASHIRLRRRMKSQEELLDDERVWWLYQLLDGASLRARQGVITVDNLRAGHLGLFQPVSPFEIASSLLAGKWEQTRTLLREWEKAEVDESTYFGLYAVVGWQLKQNEKKVSPAARAHVRQLLAEVEIMAKNFVISLAWLTDLLINRLQEAAALGKRRRIVSSRKLWLAHMSRV